MKICDIFSKWKHYMPEPYKPVIVQKENIEFEAYLAPNPLGGFLWHTKNNKYVEYSGTDKWCHL